jgi:hypothetical protein
MTWGMIGGAAIGAAGSYLSSKNGSSSSPSGNATTTKQQQVDPRIDNMLFGGGPTGNGPQTGLLSQFQNNLYTPQSDATKWNNSANTDYLNNYGHTDPGIERQAALKLMNGNNAALGTVPAYAQGSAINAPSQNGVNLTPTFQSLLSGGNNTALRDSLQYGTDLTGAQFQKNQTDLTNNLQRNVLPGIRSNAVLAGQYGGSRQGVAEGNAISDYTNQLNNSNTQMGLANSANTTGQLASDYQQGQNRALSAAQGLSGQQYATASQNANTANAAEFMNVGNVFDMNKFNASTTNQVNAQNTASAISGTGMLNGLLGQAQNTVSAQDNYALQHAQGVSSLLSPYIGTNGTTTSSQPIYQNTAGNLLGGAAAGLGLYSQYKQAIGNNSNGSNGIGSSADYSSNDWLSS